MENRKLTEELKTFIQNLRGHNREVLEKRLFELNAAYHISKELSGVSTLTDCLKILVERIVELMAVEIVSVMLIDKESNALRIITAKGLKDEIIKAASIGIGESYVGSWVAKTGEPLLVEDITGDRRFNRQNGKYYNDSLLSVPLKIHDQVIGVINVNNKVSRDTFRKDDLRTLKAVADLSAAAVYNILYKEEVHARDKFRLDFLSNVSHELGTPLSVISEAVCLVLDGIGGDVSDRQREFLEVAKNNSERLRRLINELLELTRLETTKVTIKKKLFNIVATVKTVVSSFITVMQRKGISITVILPDKDIQIWGNEDKISQVLTNLIGNAIKYNKQDGEVEVKLEESNAAVKICVCDTGEGIPREDLDKIFNRFYRVAIRKGRNKVVGAGLGLSITKAIVERHNGEITVDSEVDKGSTFTVILPKGPQG